MKQAILTALKRLKPGTTECPGKLARRLGTTQRAIRPTLEKMARTGHVIVSQGGEPANLATLRGPYRVAIPVDGNR